MSRTVEESPATRNRSVRRHPRGVAILAIAAGTALLLGGAGTYAYWSTETALAAGTVESGDLDLTLGAGSWTLAGALQPATAVDEADLGDVRLVPGDVLTLSQPLTVTLEGDTIAADLTAALGDDFTTGALAAYLDVDLTVPGLGTETTPNTYRITGDTEETVTATLTITFRSTTDQRNGVNSTVDLNGVAFALSQATS